jgi:hypothetical protein
MAAAAAEAAAAAAAAGGALVSWRGRRGVSSGGALGVPLGRPVISSSSSIVTLRPVRTLTVAAAAAAAEEEEEENLDGIPRTAEGARGEGVTVRRTDDCFSRRYSHC